MNIKQTCEFIAKIRSMSDSELHQLVLNEVGDELSSFMVQYSENLMNLPEIPKAPLASGLMLMGFLLGLRHKESLSSPGDFWQKPAMA